MRPFVNPAFSGPVIIASPNEWFNPAAFLAPPNNSGFYGNLGRDTLPGPGLATLDTSLTKDTRIRGKLNLQLRAEFFNFLNHANLKTPNAVVFNTIGSLADRGRDHQHLDHIAPVSVGLKLLW